MYQICFASMLQIYISDTIMYTLAEMKINKINFPGGVDWQVASSTNTHAHVVIIHCDNFHKPSVPNGLYGLCQICPMHTKKSIYSLAG